MMYASLATAAPSVGRARVTPSASSRSNLGAGRAMRGLGSESLHRSNGAAGVRLSRRRVATPCRAKTLEERIASGEFTKPRSSPAEDLLNGVRGLIRNVDNPQARGLSVSLAKLSRRWRNESMSRMPVAAGDIREIAGQPVFEIGRAHV